MKSMGEAEYARSMIKHHQDAVDMSKSLLQGKPRNRIRTFAEKVVDAQSKEITWLKKWLEMNT